MYLARQSELMLLPSVILKKELMHVWQSSKRKNCLNRILLKNNQLGALPTNNKLLEKSIVPNNELLDTAARGIDSLRVKELIKLYLDKI